MRRIPTESPTLHLSGSITALATPFLASGELDLQAWRALLQQQIDGGTQGVVVAGSTGEAAALSDEEYDTLLRIAVEEVRGRIPVLAGTGQMNTARTIAATRRAEAGGAQFALVVTPPYVRPTQAGLLAHYRAVADQGGLPVVLYNVPGRTGCDLLPETVAALVDHPGIVGIKEARAEPERMAALLALRRDGFAILSGDDPTAGRAMLAGADGLISVGSNALPRTFRRLCDLARAGRADAVAALDAGCDLVLLCNQSLGDGRAVDELLDGLAVARQAGSWQPSPDSEARRLALLPETLPIPWDELMLQPAYMQALDLLP